MNLSEWAAREKRGEERRGEERGALARFARSAGREFVRSIGQTARRAAGQLVSQATWLGCLSPDRPTARLPKLERKEGRQVWS